MLRPTLFIFLAATVLSFGSLLPVNAQPTYTVTFPGGPHEVPEGGSKTIQVILVDINCSNFSEITWLASLSGSGPSPAEPTDYSAPLPAVFSFSGNTVEVSFTLNSLPDSDPLPETVLLTLSGLATTVSCNGRQPGQMTYTETITLLDDDPFPTVSVQDLVWNEGSDGGSTTAAVTFEVMNAPIGELLSIDWTAFSDATPFAASPGVDFTPTSGTATFTSEASRATVDVLIPVTADSSPEPNEYFFVRINSVSFTANVADNEAKITIVDDDPGSSLILYHSDRLRSELGLDDHQIESLVARLLTLAAMPMVDGHILDLAAYIPDPDVPEVPSLTNLYLEWDENPDPAADAALANAVVTRLRQLIVSHRQRNPNLENVLLIGDDRIFPWGRMLDGTRTTEELYADRLPSHWTLPAQPGPGKKSKVRFALEQSYYLSDDPLAAASDLPASSLFDGSTLIVPDLAVGRLVETYEEMVAALDSFFFHNGTVDLAGLSSSTATLLITGSNHLGDGAKIVCEEWNQALFGLPCQSPSSSQARSLIHLTNGATEQLTEAFANGPWKIVSLAGHGSHTVEGAPLADETVTSEEGLSAALIYGENENGCQTGTGPGFRLDGSIVYSAGSHGGLSVPAGCTDNPTQTLDLPQTYLAKGALVYLGNTGFVWGLKKGIGFSERLWQQLAAGAETTTAGRWIRQAKRAYHLHALSGDPHHKKTSMQVALFGFPMARILLPDSAFASRKSESGSTHSRSTSPNGSQPPNLVSKLRTLGPNELGPYEKFKANGDRVTEANSGCHDDDGCYIKLAGNATAEPFLPIQPFTTFSVDEPATHFQGVLWLGGNYREETPWIEVIAQPWTNVDNQIEGPTGRPLPIMIKPRGIPPRAPASASSNCVQASEAEIQVVPSILAEQDSAVQHREILFDELHYETFHLNGIGDCRGPIVSSYWHSRNQTDVTFWVTVRHPNNGDSTGPRTWRVVVVYDDKLASTWRPLELSLWSHNDTSSIWRGRASVEKTTYFVQAVDTQGNVEWYGSAQAEGSFNSPEAPLGIEIDVCPSCIFSDGFESGDLSAWQ